MNLYDRLNAIGPLSQKMAEHYQLAVEDFKCAKDMKKLTSEEMKQGNPKGSITVSTKHFIEVVAQNQANAGDRCWYKLMRLLYDEDYDYENDDSEPSLKDIQDLKEKGLFIDEYGDVRFDRDKPLEKLAKEEEESIF